MKPVYTRLPFLLVLLVLLGSYTCASADLPAVARPEWVSVWAKASDRPGYDRASAHDPAYDDNGIWPMLEGSEAFVRQQWPKASVASWAHPGEDGLANGGRPGMRGSAAGPGKHDCWDLNNWLLEGKPADQSVESIEDLFDRGIDFVLPDSDKPYIVDFRNAGYFPKDRPDLKKQPIKNQWHRHVTVGRNARLLDGGDGMGPRIVGNLWIKAGGEYYGQGALHLQGSACTFIRNDNPQSPVIHQYIDFARELHASVEMLGSFRTSDEFMIRSDVIIGRDSKVLAGRHAKPVIDGGATLTLLDGAMWGKWANDFYSPCLTVNNGHIRGGAPDRPLTQPCWLAVGFKNHTAARPAQQMEKAKLARQPSLLVRRGSISSIARGEARLVITDLESMGIAVVTRNLSEEGMKAMSHSQYERLLKNKGPELESWRRVWAWFDSLPRGIDCFIGAEVTVENVQFDRLRKGGLLMPDPAAVGAWKNVSYGPGCFAAPAELPSKVEKIGGGDEVDGY